MTPAIERSGLLATDIEVRRLQYAETLPLAAALRCQQGQPSQRSTTNVFCRMFEFYLSSCELDFRADSMAVFQIQLAHGQTAVPLTRDDTTESDRGLA